MRVRGGIDKNGHYALYFEHRGENITLTLSPEMVAKQILTGGPAKLLGAVAHGLELALRTLLGEETEEPDVKVEQNAPDVRGEN